MKLMYKIALSALAALLLVGAMATAASATELWERYEIVPNPSPAHPVIFSGTSANVTFTGTWGAVECRKVSLVGELIGPRELKAVESYSECSGGVKPFETHLTGMVGAAGAKRPAVRLEPEGTKNFDAEFKNHLPLVGSVIGFVAPANEKTSTFTLSYSGFEGNQYPLKFQYAYSEPSNRLLFDEIPTVLKSEIKITTATKVEFWENPEL